MNDAVQMQREYYRDNAEAYEEGWSHVNMELILPFALLTGFVDVLGITSLLDIGSGTGRGLRTIQQLRPNLRMVGIEPSGDLREMGYRSGLGQDMLMDGDATKLVFEDNEFDLVCEFGSLHHMRRPDLAVKEMLRVAGKAVVISDINNFGEGARLGRLAKQALNAIGMWKTVDKIKTKGSGYRVSPGDGISYSYSAFNDLALLEKSCRSVHVFNVDGSGRRPYSTSAHVVLVGIKTDQVAGLGSRI